MRDQVVRVCPQPIRATRLVVPLNKSRQSSRSPGRIHGQHSQHVLGGSIICLLAAICAFFIREPVREKAAVAEEIVEPVMASAD